MKLSWLQNRLSVMGPSEILFRVGRLISTRYEWLRHKLNIGSTRVPELTVAQSLFYALNGEDDDSIDSSAMGTSAVDKSDCDNDGANSNVASLEKSIQLFYQHPTIQHTSINWSQDPKTGQIAPESFGKLIDYRNDEIVGDIKYLWELGRHQFLIPLAIDVYCSGDSDAEKKLSMYLETWLDQNPVNQGIHWCSSLEAALRLIAWSFVHSILLAANKKNGIFELVSDAKALQISIFCQIRFIQSYYSRHSSANNHLIGELVGVWVSCNVFEFSDNTEKWRTNAQSELEKEAYLQNHSDGVNREQAIYYHLWVLEYLLLAWLIGQRFNRPFSANFVDMVGQMAGFLQNMCTKNGSPPLIGDADGGQVARFDHEISESPYDELLQSIEACTHTSTVHKSPYSKAYWYSKITSPDKEQLVFQRIKELSEPQSLPVQYQTGGYSVLGDEKIKVCFKAGAMGYLSTAAHGHADLLSVCLAVDDHWWLTDQGTYSYHSEAQWRDYFRGTSAHNTVQVESENQSSIGGAFLWLEKASASMSALSTGASKAGLQTVSADLHWASDAKINHRRTLEFEESTRTLSICDDLTLAEDAQPTSVKIRFHFHPLINLEQNDAHGYSAKMPGQNERLEVQLPEDLNWELLKGQTSPVIEGWYSDAYDSKVPCNVLVGTTEISSNRKFHSSITLV